MPRLKNCAVVKDRRNGYSCLFGEIYEDFRFTDGHHVLTSKLAFLNEDEGIAKTKSGTLYSLDNFMSVSELCLKIQEDYADDPAYQCYLLSMFDS